MQRRPAQSVARAPESFTISAQRTRSVLMVLAKLALVPPTASLPPAASLAWIAGLAAILAMAV